MPFCPQCGREQRCGCETCHACGVPLVGTPAPVNVKTGEAGAGRQERQELAWNEPGSRGTSRAGSALCLALAVMGAAVLLIALVESLNSISGFPRVAAGTFTVELKRTGYYLGNLLYSASIRLLIGFAIILLGLLMPPGPRLSERAARSLIRAAGITMGALSALYLLAFFIIAAPGDVDSLLISNLLPSRAVALPVILFTGAALIFCGWEIIKVGRVGGISVGVARGGGRTARGGTFPERASRGKGRDDEVARAEEGSGR